MGIYLNPGNELFKRALRSKIYVDKSAPGAIAQIKERQYVKALEDYAGEIVLVGINYDRQSKKHECIIEKYMIL